MEALREGTGSLGLRPVPGWMKTWQAAPMSTRRKQVKTLALLLGFHLLYFYDEVKWVAGLMERNKCRQVSFFINFYRANKLACDGDITSLGCQLVICCHQVKSWIVSKRTVEGLAFPSSCPDWLLKSFCRGHSMGWCGHELSSQVLIKNFEIKEGAAV